MPHFTLNIGPDGPVLKVLIGVSEVRAAALSDPDHLVPNPVAVNALLDTGASHTCLDPSVVKDLALSPTGSVSVTAPAAGAVTQTADEYDVSLWIPAAIGEAPLVFPTLPVFCSELHHSGFRALIGRDILADCLLAYNGRTGLYTLAY